MKSEYSTGFSSGSLVKLTASMLIFGTVGIFRRSIPVSSEFLAFSRGILGALFLLGFLGLRKNRKNTRIQPVPRSALLWLVLSGAAIGVNWILLFEAYRYTTVAVATLCYYMQPTIVILLSPLLFRERLTAKKLVCAFLSILGLVLLSGVTIPGVTIPGLTIPGAAAAAGSAGDPRGILYGLGAAALYAFVVILNKLLPHLDAVVKTMIQLFSAAAVMIPYLLITRNPGLEKMSGTGWFLLVLMGFVHTGIAYVLYFSSMDLPAQTVAVFSYLDPVSALFFAWIFLGESLSAAGALGAVLILGSALVSERSGA